MTPPTCRRPSDRQPRSHRLQAVTMAVAALTLAMSTLLAPAGRASAASRWTLQRVAKPQGFAYGDLVGISCPSRLDCVAVGSFHNAADRELPLVERWDGNAWSVEATPLPAKATAGTLLDVACTSAAGCTAVGTYQNSSFTTIPLIEHLDGGSWTIQPTPRSAALNDFRPASVSCPSASMCVAAGFSESDNQPHAARWNGSKWSLMRTRSVGENGGSLYGVSCTSTSACTAVGSRTDPKTDCGVPLVEAWNGRRWSIRPSPAPGPCGSSDEALRAVSCLSATACNAVGYDDSMNAGPGIGVPLLERSSARSWSVQPSPDIRYLEDPWGGGGWLNGVSCKPRGSCVAVGAASSEIITRPLVMRWAGDKWTVDTTARLPLDGGLEAVSCSSMTACTAVGFDDTRGANTDVPLVESTLNPSGGPPPSGGLG
jgi:hypothetical protein